jgi:hypothetical protein
METPFFDEAGWQINSSVLPDLKLEVETRYRAKDRFGIASGLGITLFQRDRQNPKAVWRLK